MQRSSLDVDEMDLDIGFEGTCQYESQSNCDLISSMSAITINAASTYSKTNLHEQVRSSNLKENSFLTGLHPIICDLCKMRANKLVVKQCSGAGTRQCNVNLCMYCAMACQRSQDSQLSQSTLHYCRSCSEDFRAQRAAQQNALLCSCAGDCAARSVDILEQPDSQWQCLDCRGTAGDHIIAIARHNLTQLEREQLVFPLDWYHSPEHGLKRWIHEEYNSECRNACPGCGCGYVDLVHSWSGHPRVLLADCGTLVPQEMIVLCTVCLRAKSKTRQG